MNEHDDIDEHDEHDRYVRDDFESFAGVHLSFFLSWAELNVLEEQFGVGLPPLLPGNRTSDGDGHELLRARGMVDDDGLTELGNALLDDVLRPVIVIGVERISPDVRHIWLYNLDEDGFAEQVQVDNGLHWFLADTDQLLGRILMNSGVLRTSAASRPDDVADPLPDQTVFDVVISMHLGGGQDAPALVLQYRDGAWSHAMLIGPSELSPAIAASPDELVDVVVDFIDASVARGMTSPT